jgi:hypothetical protein
MLFLFLFIIYHYYRYNLYRHRRDCHCRFELGTVWRQGAGVGDAAANAHLIPEELFVADFDISINTRPSDPVYAAALIEYFAPNSSPFSIFNLHLYIGVCVFLFNP